MEDKQLNLTVDGVNYFDYGKEIARDNIGLNEEHLYKLLEYNKKLEKENSEFRISFKRMNDNQNTIDKETLLNFAVEGGDVNLQKDKDFIELPRGIQMEESANAIRAFNEFKDNFYTWYDLPLNIKIEMQSIEEYKKRKRFFRKTNSEFVDYRNTLPYREILESRVKHWIYGF
jgi:hypothetical protein